MLPGDQRDTGPPTKPVQLPDFKPKGMTTFDKICAWLMAFLIVITLIAFGHETLSHHLNDKPAAKATATASATPGKKSTAGNSCPTK